MILRCAAYARYSSTLQSPVSIDDQIRKCREYAQQQGWKLLDSQIYSDEAISGATDNRDGLTRLLATATAGAFDVILVDDTSRISRKLADSLRIFEQLRFIGVRVVFVSQGIDTDSEQAEVLLATHGIVDSLYIRELGKKVHRGIEGRALKGLHTGGRCFGYRSAAIEDATETDNYGRPIITGVRLEIEVREAATVKRIFECYAAGDSLKTIAKRLNVERVPSPSPYRGQTHPSWAPGALSVMLRNERYKGTVVWNRTRKIRDPRTGRRIQRLRPTSEWRVLYVPALRIVSDELWQRVERRRSDLLESFASGNRKGLCTRSFSARYLFSGFLKCGLCGSNLVMVSGRGQSDWGKYGCPLHHFRGMCGNALMVRRVKLEREILAGFGREVLREDVVSYALEEFGRQLRAKVRAAKDGVAAMRVRREKLRTEIANLSRAIAETGHSAGLLAELSAREREQDAICDEIFSTDDHGLEAHLNEIEHFVRNRFRDIRSLLLADVPRAKAELAKHCTAITVTPESGTYRIGGDWDFLGGRSDGAEGQNRTAYAGLFRAALYR